MIATIRMSITMITTTTTIMMVFGETRRWFEPGIVVAVLGGSVTEGEATPSAELPIATVTDVA